MKKLCKKAIVSSLVKLIILAIAVILLFFLIKNGWDVKAAFNDMVSFLSF